MHYPGLVEQVMVWFTKAFASVGFIGGSHFRLGDTEGMCESDFSVLLCPGNYSFAGNWVPV